MRYVWDMYHVYYKGAPFFKRMLMPLLMHYLRMWDVSSSHRVTHFIANSQYVANRINRYYHRDAEVINPPVSSNNFSVADRVGDFYLMVGQLVDYKRVDIAIDAFNETGRQLIIIGEGDLLESYKRKAEPNIQLLGRQPDSKLKEYYSRCKALIFPGIEDFGIVPLEAMASGRPVIAYAKGGALETVIHGETGLLFHEQTSESLNKSIVDFEESRYSFNPHYIRSHAKKFDTSRFKNEIINFISRVTSSDDSIN